jgi:hypothetical protein
MTSAIAASTVSSNRLTIDDETNFSDQFCNSSTTTMTFAPLTISAADMILGTEEVVTSSGMDSDSDNAMTMTVTAYGNNGGTTVNDNSATMIRPNVRNNRKQQHRLQRNSGGSRRKHSTNGNKKTILTGGGARLRFVTDSTLRHNFEPSLADSAALDDREDDSFVFDKRRNDKKERQLMDKMRPVSGGRKWDQKQVHIKTNDGEYATNVWATGNIIV